VELLIAQSRPRPLGDGLCSRRRKSWPQTAVEWPEEPEIVERVPLRACNRRGRRSTRWPSLGNGRLRFALGELAVGPRAALVVEDRYRIVALDRIRPAVVAELQVRWPAIPIVFCMNHKLADGAAGHRQGRAWLSVRA